MFLILNRVQLLKYLIQRILFMDGNVQLKMAHNVLLVRDTPKVVYIKDIMLLMMLSLKTKIQIKSNQWFLDVQMKKQVNFLIKKQMVY